MKSAFLLMLGLAVCVAPCGAQTPAVDGLDPRPPCTKNAPLAPLTVVDAVDLALCRHPQTQEVWAQARVQAAQLGIASAAWWPRLDGRATLQQREQDGSRSEARTAELALSWLLYDGGVRAANEDSARHLLQAALGTRDATLQTVILAAVRAYFTAQASSAAVEAARLAEKAAARSLDVAEARYRAGVATPADRLQAQTAWSQATLSRIRAEGEAANARGALAHALGFPAQVPLSLAPAPALPAAERFTRDVERLIDDALRQRPDLKALSAQVEAAEASLRAARAQRQPSLTLGAGPLWQSLAGREIMGGSLGVTLSLPIFTGYEQTWRIRQAEAQREVREAQRARLAQQVALDVWQAWHSLRTATQALSASRDLLASAEQSARVALGRYQAGVGTVLDLLTAQAAEAGARQQRIQTELEWNVYRAMLAQALGSLDGSLLQEGEEMR